MVRQKVHSALVCHSHENAYVHRLGDVIYLNALGKDIVVLNSEQAANDLLDKRSANYSDRSYMPVYDLYVSLFSR